jgi:hypothetical protein
MEWIEKNFSQFFIIEKKFMTFSHLLLSYIINHVICVRYSFFCWENGLWGCCGRLLQATLAYALMVICTCTCMELPIASVTEQFKSRNGFECEIQNWLEIQMS